MIAVIGVTREDLRQIVYDAMSRSRVDDDTPRSIMVLPIPDYESAKVYCEFEVTPMSEQLWLARIAHMKEILENKKFHVEHTVRLHLYRDAWKHRIVVRHVYPRPV